MKLIKVTDERHKQVKIKAAQEEREIQELVDDALAAYLTKRNKKE